MSDLIKRSDAIKALRKLGHEVVVIDKVCSLGVAHEFIDVIRELPSADRPIVVRVRTIMKKEDYDNLEKRINQQNPNVIVIPHNAELVTPVDRPQGEWMPSESAEWISPIADFYKCSICGKRVNLFQMRSYRFCPNCGARMKGADDDNA